PGNQNCAVLHKGQHIAHQVRSAGGDRLGIQLVLPGEHLRLKELGNLSQGHPCIIPLIRYCPSWESMASQVIFMPWCSPSASIFSCAEAVVRSVCAASSSRVAAPIPAVQSSSSRWARAGTGLTKRSLSTCSITRHCSRL